MIDINAKVKWSKGTEITTELLNGIEESTEERQRLLRRVMYGTRYGILPGTKCDVRGFFVRKHFEFEVRSLKALLPSGKLLDIEEKSKLAVPKLAEGDYFIAVGFGEKMVEFTSKGVIYSRPEYVYRIYGKDDVEEHDVLPLFKLKVEDGTLTMVEDYLAPCMQADSYDCFREIVGEMAERTRLIAEHKSMGDGDGRRAVLEFVFRLKGLDRCCQVTELIALLKELARAVDYYIIQRYAEEKDIIPECRQSDVKSWIDWMNGYLEKALSVLDGVTLDNDKIDYETLKAQLKEEIIGQLREEMGEKINASVGEMGERLNSEITDCIKRYVDEEFRETLTLEISENLQNALRNELYDSLFDDLYNALYVPEKEEEEDKFMPLI